MKYRKFLFSILFLTLITKMGWGQLTWSRSDIPNGGQIVGLEYHQPTHSFFAITKWSKMYHRSQDSTQWTFLGTLPDGDLGYDETGSKELPDGTIFVLGADLALSRDGGITWQTPSSPAGAGMYSVTQYSDSVYLCGMYERRIQKSTDRGLTWDFSDSGFYDPNIRYHSIIVEKIPGNILLACGDTTNTERGGAIFRSTDGGRNWVRCGTTPTFVTCVTGNGPLTYANTYWGATYRSNDSGQTWSLDTRIDARTTFFDHQGTIWAYFGNYIQYSTNQGNTWVSCTSNRFAFAAISSTVDSLNQIYFGSNGGGVAQHISDSTFRFQNYGLESAIVNCIYRTSSGRMFVGTYGRGLYYSDSDPMNLQLADTTYGQGTVIDKIVEMPDHSLLTLAGGVSRSTDNGVTWTYRGYVFGYSYDLVAIGDTVFCPTSIGLFKSTDYGSSWIRIYSDIAFSFAGKPDGNYFILNNDHVPTRSSDYGATWTASSMNYWPDVLAQQIRIDRTGALLVCGQGFFRSTNNGTFWVRLLSSSNTQDVFTDSLNNYYLLGSLSIGGNNPRSLSFSWNQGASVDTIFSFHTNTYVTSVALDNSGHIWMGSSDLGLFYSDEPMGINGASKSTLPNSVSMQNYPNPFNPTTRISFSIPVSSPVTLDLFDITGRHIDRLVNGKMNAGSHSVMWNGVGVSSGMYLCRLNAGKESKTGKMMLLK